MAECPECEAFRDNPARYRWCRNEAGDLERTNSWRRGQKLWPYGASVEEQARYLNDSRPLEDRKELTAWTKNSENNPPLVLVGPGTEFAGIMTVLGITMPDGCECKKTMFKMNDWGIEKCRERFDELVQKIRDHEDAWGWKDKLKNWRSGGWNYAKHPELWRWVNPINPIPGLLRLAIHLAEKKGTAS